MMTSVMRLFLVTLVSSISASLQATSDEGIGCLLPDFPDGGDYKITTTTGCDGPDRLSAKCRPVPGTLVQSNTTITYNCFKSFRLEPNNTISVCFNGNWYPGTPSCIRLCKPLESKSLIINCIYKGSPVNCTSQGVLPGTKASLKCKQFYQSSGYNYGLPICDSDGSWSESLFSCRPECGIATINNDGELIGRVSSVKYPWHAGLYKFVEELNEMEFLCGGTVITPYMILTAAHCVYDMKSQPGEIHVAVGKTTRSWKIIDPGEQRFHVSKLITHSGYRGSVKHYAFDIALLELTQNIVVGTTAMPVCLEAGRPGMLIENGRMGTVVGWGKNELGEPISALQVVHLAYLDGTSCKRRAATFRDFVTHDKFCATPDFREAGVGTGDSGGGLVFYNEESDRYFLRGVVSTKPTDHNTFITFTNISDETIARFIEDTRYDLHLRHQ